MWSNAGRVLEKTREVERAHGRGFSKVRQTNLLVEMVFYVLEYPLQTRHGYLAAGSEFTWLHNSILSRQKHGHSIANLLTKQPSRRSALLQLLMKNLEHVFKAWISERPSFRNFHLCARKASFGKPLKMCGVKLENHAIVIPVPAQTVEAGRAMQR